MAQTPLRRRPLVGEPIAMDLLNTRWVEGDQVYDLLDSLEGLADWFEESGLAARFVADEATLDHLLRTRNVIARLVEEPLEAEAAAELNEVLSHGGVRRLLVDGVAAETVEFDRLSWGPSWTAAADYLDLRGRPDRIRGCANPACVLHFFDTSKNGTRRWCSMSACGNRAKAARHHARRR
ncbi:CGNR zinc finger domain-containing protein [Nocardiopsis alba]|jgi:predicted RNA-binding Zn ribbon-like protein|nr:CGNR zinc finger domain-containing protein [Nocardiopsis alba]